jgi:aryl-alcohol dehydrogenase-like predicted oxidoreductase
VAAPVLRRLGQSGIDVSVVSLGSWRTYERLPRERGVAVLREARERGITFLDDARYDDETGTAPLRTGWSEVLFGELFRAAGWNRDEVVVANKLWWEFWPDETAAAELDGSLGRLGFDHVDLIYSARPPAGLPVADLVAAVIGLIESGKARAWGLLNWPTHQIDEAARVCAADSGLPAPCAAQLAYNLVARSPVEDDDTAAALQRCGASVVASAVLAFGALTGRGATGRAAERPNARALAVAEELRPLATRFETTPARLAIAFALAHPLVASVLFGASSPEQVAENVGAVELLDRLSAAELAELRSIGAGA